MARGAVRSKQKERKSGWRHAKRAVQREASRKKERPAQREAKRKERKAGQERGASPEEEKKDAVRVARLAGSGSSVRRSA